MSKANEPAFPGWNKPEDKMSGLYEMVELRFTDGEQVWRNTLIAELREMRPEHYNTILWRPFAELEKTEK